MARRSAHHDDHEHLEPGDMGLIQVIWPAWLGLEKRDFKIYWDIDQTQRSFYLQCYKLFFVF